MYEVKLSLNKLWVCYIYICAFHYIRSCYPSNILTWSTPAYSWRGLIRQYRECLIHPGMILFLLI